MCSVLILSPRLRVLSEKSCRLRSWKRLSTPIILSSFHLCFLGLEQLIKIFHEQLSLQLPQYPLPHQKMPRLLNPPPRLSFLPNKSLKHSRISSSVAKMSKYTILHSSHLVMWILTCSRYKKQSVNLLGRNSRRMITV